MPDRRNLMFSPELMQAPEITFLKGHLTTIGRPAVWLIGRTWRYVVTMVCRGRNNRYVSSFFICQTTIPAHCFEYLRRVSMPRYPTALSMTSGYRASLKMTASSMRPPMTSYPKTKPCKNKRVKRFPHILLISTICLKRTCLVLSILGHSGYCVDIVRCGIWGFVSNHRPESRVNKN